MEKSQKAVPKAYRFSVGQRVTLLATRFDRFPLAGTFKITARLPAEESEQQYRVKHDGEAFERRVGEHRLTLLA